MGLGPFKNGRHKSITPYQGSWAQQEEERKAKGLPLKVTDPRYRDHSVKLPGTYDRYGKKIAENRVVPPGKPNDTNITIKNRYKRAIPGQKGSLAEAVTTTLRAVLAEMANTGAALSRLTEIEDPAKNVRGLGLKPEKVQEAAKRRALPKLVESIITWLSSIPARRC